MGRKYRCDECGGEFEAEWSEEEAVKEKIENGWGEMSDDDMAVVCDDCYKDIMRSIN